MKARNAILGLAVLAVPLAAIGAPAVRDGLLFYASYDRGPHADFAKGNRRAVRYKGKGLAAGRRKKALLFRRKGGMLLCEYQAKGNILPNHGTIAFHFRPDWADPGKMGHCFFFRPGKANAGTGCNAPDTMTVLARRHQGRDAEIWFWRDDHGGGNHLTRMGLESWKPGAWHHVAVTWGSEAAEIYVDGELKGRRRGGGLITEPDTMFFVGSSRKGVFCAEGALDELCIYDRALTQAEIGLLTGLPELVKPRILSLTLEQNLYYRSEKRVAARIALAGRIDPRRLRLSATLTQEGKARGTADHRMEAVSGRHEVTVEAPEEGDYVLVVRLTDAAGKKLDEKSAKLHVIDGPFDR